MLPTTHCEYVQPSAITSHTWCRLAVVSRVTVSELSTAAGDDSIVELLLSFLIRRAVMATASADQLALVGKRGAWLPQLQFVSTKYPAPVGPNLARCRIRVSRMISGWPWLGAAGSGSPGMIRDNTFLRGRTSLPHAVQAAQYFAREVSKTTASVPIWGRLKRGVLGRDARGGDTSSSGA